MSNYEQLSQAVSGTYINDGFEVWDLVKIRTLLNISDSTAKRLVLEEGFPAPIVNKERNRRWVASAVIGYLLERSGQSEGKRSTPRPSNHKRTFNLNIAKLAG